MGKLQEKIETDLKDALKNKDSASLSTLRLIKSDLQYELSKTGSKKMADEDMEKILTRAVKKRKEAIEQYENSNRKDLLDKEKTELELIKKYLPPSVPESEIIAIIEDVSASQNISGMKDMGKLMGIIMARLKGRTVDGTLVRQLLTKKLQSFTD